MTTIRNRTKITEVPTELKKLAGEHYRANAQMNALKRSAEKARKALYAGMKEMGIEKFSFTTTVDSKKVGLTSLVSTGVGRSSIDVVRLRRAVSDEEVFMKMVSATAKAVTAHAGSDIAAQCSVPGVGTENVSVKPTK